MSRYLRSKDAFLLHPKANFLKLASRFRQGEERKESPDDKSRFSGAIHRIGQGVQFVSCLELLAVPSERSNANEPAFASRRQPNPAQDEPC